MWQEHRQLIYRLDMTRRGVYWSRQRFTGWIANCLKSVYCRVRREGKDRGGNSFPREAEQRCLVMTPHVHTHHFLSLCINVTFCCITVYPCVTFSSCLCFSSCTISVYRSYCFLLEGPFSTTLTTLSSTVASVPTTSRSRRSLREVWHKPNCLKNKQQPKNTLSAQCEIKKRHVINRFVDNNSKGPTPLLSSAFLHPCCIRDTSRHSLLKVWSPLLGENSIMY